MKSAAKSYATVIAAVGARQRIVGQRAFSAVGASSPAATGSSGPAWGATAIGMVLLLGAGRGSAVDKAEAEAVPNAPSAPVIPSIAGEVAFLEAVRLARERVAKIEAAIGHAKPGPPPPAPPPPPLTPKQLFESEVAKTAARVLRIESAITQRVERKRATLQGQLAETAERLGRIEEALNTRERIPPGTDLTKSLVAVLERMEAIESSMQRMQQ